MQFSNLIADSACIIWDNTCGKKGNCWLYDSDRFRLLIHFVPAALLLLATIGDIIVFVNCKDLKLYDDEVPKQSNKEVEQEEIALMNKECGEKG